MGGKWVEIALKNMSKLCQKRYLRDINLDMLHVCHCADLVKHGKT